MLLPGRVAPLGAGVLLLAIATAPAVAQVANDGCVESRYVTSLPFSDVQPIGAATLEPGERDPACASGLDHSVWYAMTPPVSAVYAFSTCGSDFDTVVQLYEGPSCTALGQITPFCSDDFDLCGPGSRQGNVVFRRPGGPQHLVYAQVGSKGPAAGTLRFSMQLVPKATNDECAAARAIGHPVYREVLDIAGAGAGEVADLATLTRCGVVGTVHLGDSAHSIWYTYTPAVSGPVVIDPTGTNTPIVIAVFKDLPEGCARLGARAACQANRPVIFDAEAGQGYRIYVATPTPVSPDILLFRLTGPNQPPVAHASGPAVVAPGTPVALTAFGSLDPDGDPITFTWRQTSGPSVALSDPTSPRPGFTAPLVTVDTPLGFELAVTDGAAVTTAPVTVTVSPSVADPDGDGVPLPTDLCPSTGPGEVVDESGCSCRDTGHPGCAGDGDPCAAGRCDPTTARCLPDAAPPGTPCADDGNLCTQDVCDGAGTCAHPLVQCARACRTEGCDPGTGQCLGAALPPGTRCAEDGDPCTDDVCDVAGTCTHPAARAFTGATCRIEALAARFGASSTLPARFATRLARMIGETRVGIVTAEAAATVGDPRRARRRLGRAAVALTRFTRLIVRLEVRHRLPPPEAGILLDAAQNAALDIAELKATLPAPGR